jgi:hypothetical protein
MPQTLPTFHVLPVGWDHPGWKGVFYPDDLPPEWRLSYFANEFSAVLVPQYAWEGEDKVPLGGWVDDVSDGFRFFLELAEPIEFSVARKRFDILGENLGGFVLPRYVTGDGWRETWLAMCRQHKLKVFEAITSVFPAASRDFSHDEESKLALLITDKLDGNLRDQRIFFERLRDSVPQDAQILLCFSGDPPRIEAIQKLQQLAQLMGLA